MKDITRNHLDRGRRVADFNAAHAASFPAGSRASVLTTEIGAAVTALETLGAKQDAAELDRQQATDQKDAVRLILLSLLRAISGTARGMERLFPGITARFRMPRGSDQNLLDRARAFIVEATPMAADFTGRGLPVNFLTALEAAAVALEAAITSQNQALAAQTNATAALLVTQKQLSAAVSEFSPIVRNIFAGDPATLAEWESASHVKSAPKKAKGQATPPPTP